MRAIRNPQTTFCFQHTRESARMQWEEISNILEANSVIAELVWQDLNRDRYARTQVPTGAKGMTADQVLRFAIAKTCLGLSYRALYDRVDDSIILRDFCRVPFGKIPAVSTLQENIKRISPQTFDGINAVIVQYAVELKLEDGKRIRIDSTAVESNIHHPTDSAQLWDAVRVLTRILYQVESEVPDLRGEFHDHTRVAKKLRYKINNARGQQNRKPLYKRLIDVAQKTVTYAHHAIAALTARHGESLEELFILAGLRDALEEIAPLAERVIDQSIRRVLKGEQVPAEAKVVSIFEPHTDIIKKGQREVVYGHKIFLSTGNSNLILDCAIEKGNPADSEQFIPALERHCERFGAAPRDVATDGGFASKANGEKAREMDVKNTAFSTLKGNALDYLVQSPRIYRHLCNWRAGIEGIISAAKRAFGLDRCHWRGYESFEAYVHLAVLSFNLQTFARHLL